MRYFNIKQEFILKQVWEYPFKNEYKLDQQEFIQFLYQCKDDGYQNENLDDKQQQINNEIILQIFKEVDKYEDLVVDKRQLIERIKNSKKGKKLLKRGCKFIPEIKRILTYEKVLEYVERQMKTDEYTSFNQFIEQLQNTNMDQVIEVESQSEDLQLVELDEEFYKIIKKCLKQCQKQRGFIDIIQLISLIKYDENYPLVQNLIGRQPLNAQLYADKNDIIPLETIEQVLNRIEKEMLDNEISYLDYNEFVCYFSSLGKPEQLYLQKDSLNNKNTDIYQNLNNFDSIIDSNDGYDSDGCIQTQNQRNRMDTQKSLKQLPQQYKEQQQQEQSQFFNSYDQNYTKIKNNYTLPEPFQLVRKDKVKKESIREKKFQQYLQEIELKKQQECQIFFKASKVPQQVKEPLLDKINQQQEERKKQTKLNSVYNTIQKQRPFSFYEKQKEKDHQNYLESKLRIKRLEIERQKKQPKRKTKIQQQDFQQKTNEIQWFITKNVGQQQSHLNEAERQERINQRAQEQLALSKLPPRMEKHMRVKQMNILRNRSQKIKEEEPFVFRRKSVPDFTKQQFIFLKTLEQKRANKRVTQVIPFHFTQKKKIANKNFLDQENENQKKKIEKKIDPIQKFKEVQKQYESQNYPTNTEKWNQYALHLQKQKQKQEKQNQKEEEIRNKKLEKQKQFAPRVQKSNFLIDNSKALKEKRKQDIEEKKQELKKQSQKYQQSLQEMKQKVQNRPLLFEIDYSQDKKLLEMKKVCLYVKTLKEGGLSKQRINELLSQQQKEIYEDYLYLSQNGYKDIFKKLEKQELQ